MKKTIAVLLLVGLCLIFNRAIASSYQILRNGGWSEASIDKYTDDNGVICYIAKGGNGAIAISCIPKVMQ